MGRKEVIMTKSGNLGSVREAFKKRDHSANLGVNQVIKGWRVKYFVS